MFRIPQPPSPPKCGRTGPEFSLRVRFNPPILAGITPAFFMTKTEDGSDAEAALAVIFQEVVHSVLTGNADVAKPQ